MSEKDIDVLIFRWGGLDRSPHVQTLFSVLTRAGFHAKAISAEENGIDVVAGVEVYGLDIALHHPSWRRHLTAAWRLEKIAKLFRPRIVYVMDSWSIPAALVLLLRFLGTAKIAYHTVDFLDPALHHWWVSVERWFSRRAAVVVNADRSRARIMKALYGLRSAPVIFPTLPSRQLRVPARSLSERFRWGLPQDAIVLVNATTPSPDRYTLEVIEAMRLLPSRFHLLTFRGQGEYARLCEEAASRSDGGVTLCDPVPYAELLLILSHCDIGIVLYDDRVSTGYFFCNPDKLGHYVACGLVVLATDQPSLASLVHGHRLGVCISTVTPETIAQGIANAAAMLSPERRIAIQHVFASSLNVEVQTEDFLAAMENLRA